MSRHSLRRYIHSRIRISLSTFALLLFSFVMPCTLLLPAPAHAQSSVVAKPLFKTFTVGDVTGASKNLLNAASCTDADAADRTVELALDGQFAKVRLAFWLTYIQADSVTSTPECSIDGTTYANYLTRTCSAGACTGTLMADTLAAEAAVDGIWEYDVKGCRKARFVFTCANAAATDTLVAQAMGFY